MSMTIGFLLRYDQAPAAPVPPSVASPTVVQGHWHKPDKVEAVAQRPPSSGLSAGPSAGPTFMQGSADRFPAYASTTYGSRGEPNRPYMPSRSRLDIYA